MQLCGTEFNPSGNCCVNTWKCDQRERESMLLDLLSNDIPCALRDKSGDFEDQDIKALIYRARCDTIAVSGRPRGTTPVDDRYIVLQTRRNRRQTAGEIARHTTQATGLPISRFTVARRLPGGGLFARRPVRCVPLKPALWRRRSLWCREHRNWRDNE
ncbi:transposable element Tcb1 transposase [Trichonephila clavipes]|nr:transposable element Tcb1 transposase [Trichonephila clavipes]